MYGSPAKSFSESEKVISNIINIFINYYHDMVNKKKHQPRLLYGTTFAME